jgi:taurine dioxygenase
MTVAPVRTRSTRDRSPSELSVRKLSATIGAEIAGVDLEEPLDDETVADLRALLLEHRVIFFRGQHLNPEQHLAFARSFGEPTAGHPVLPGLAEHPEVFEIDYSFAQQFAEQFTKSNGDYDARVWHTDVTFVAHPPLGSILNAVTIPAAGGDTQWSNQHAAYEGLSPALREFLATLTAVHDGSSQFGWILELQQEGSEWEGKRVVSLDPVEHPLIRTHEETGEPVLFVNPGFTSHIKDLAPAESRALLEFLYDHSTRPQYTVRWHWSEGDIAFWDNRVTQHAVVPDFSGQHRVIQRVTLRGTQPV